MLLLNANASISSTTSTNEGNSVDIHAPEASNYIVEGLRMCLDAFYIKYKSSDGKHIDYKSIQQEDLSNFQNILSQLNQIQLNQLTLSEKKAFFLNIYNILVIHGFLVYGLPSNILKRLYFYQQLSYQIGGLVYSLNDIEHGILRANRPFFLWFKGSSFKSKDPRAVNSITSVDPRIHFALNCGATSCPAIYLYDSKEIDMQLEMATKAFVNDSSNVLIELETKIISISKLFQWYQKDFLDFSPVNTTTSRTSSRTLSNKQRVLEDWIVPFLTPTRQEQVNTNVKWKIKYLPYNWQVNHS